MEVLAIIPARGGSKTIHEKNIQKVGDKPLLVHTIDAAKKSKLVKRVIVSTDNKRIAKIARDAGAEIPFLRPKKISGDKVPTIEVIKHTLKFLKDQESYVPDIITSLIPPSPFRTSKMIDASIRLLKSSNGTSVLGVKKIKTHPFRSFWLKGEYLKPLRTDFVKYYQRQSYPDSYYPTGAIYTFWHKTLEKYNNIYGPRICPLISKKDEIMIDIDDLFDLFVSEMTFLHWEDYKRRFRK